MFGPATPLSPNRSWQNSQSFLKRHGAGGREYVHVLGDCGNKLGYFRRLSLGIHLPEPAGLLPAQEKEK
jgi:hypothetical protein